MLLFVTEKFPWPLDDGGQIRSYQVLAALARRFPTTLVALEPPLKTDEEPIRALGIEVVTFKNHRSRWKMPWYALQSLFTRRPYPLAKNFSKEMLAEIRARIQSGQVRALHLNHIDAAQYLQYLGEFDTPGELRAQVTATFDTHNLLTKMYQRFYAESSWNVLHMAFSWIQWRKMFRYERDLMKSFELVLVCSELERQELIVWGVERTQRGPRGSVLVVPNGVDTSYFTPSASSSSSASANSTSAPHLVFTGAMAYYPNIEGLRWFLLEILPHVQKRFPGARLTIVGKDPPAGMLEFSEPGRIEFTGRVDDVRPFTRAADVFVVPLRIGGGTRLKILEALAMEVPVVSTCIGAEGLELEDGVHLRLADTIEEFTNAIAELATDRARAKALAQAGRARVLERYDWSAATKPLVDLLAKTLG